jgi:hypothetical protein
MITITCRMNVSNLFQVQINHTPTDGEDCASLVMTELYSLYPASWGETDYEMEIVDPAVFTGTYRVGVATRRHFAVSLPYPQACSVAKQMNLTVDNELIALLDDLREPPLDQPAGCGFPPGVSGAIRLALDAARSAQHHVSRTYLDLLVKQHRDSQPSGDTARRDRIHAALLTLEEFWPEQIKAALPAQLDLDDTAVCRPWSLSPSSSAQLAAPPAHGLRMAVSSDLMTGAVKAEREAVARLLWTKAQLMEQRGDDQTVGIATMDEEKKSRAMSRQSALYGQSTAYEGAAWIVLGRSGPADIDFFRKPVDLEGAT